MQDVVENNILPFWLNMQDLERGGFYGQMTGDGALMKDANRGCILNARILWSFSAAYRVLGKPEYLEAATRAKDYILEHFIDKEIGGAYWELDANGNPVDTKKQFYALGFVIYGLSEYARAIMHKEGMEDVFDLVMNEAFHLFFVIERHSWDKEFGGYIEATTCDWEPIADMRLSELDANYPKSQNTHLHIIEPYTNLYRALKEYSKTERYLSMFKHSQQLPDISNVNAGVAIKLKAVEQALRSLLDIFCNKILNPETHHLDLFFEMNWTRGAGWLESYGHDIECSWLMHETALELGDNALLAKVEPIVQLVAKASEKA